MYLLLSGEGSSDIGVCYPASSSCDADAFKAGPMAWIIDQLIEVNLGYEFSHLTTERVSFVSESLLTEAVSPEGRLFTEISEALIPSAKVPPEIVIT